MRADKKGSVLVVDDDASFRERLARAFVERGFDVRTAKDADDAIARATEDSPERALVDLRMPGRSGLEVVRALKAIDPTTSVVVLTGYGSIATALEAVRLGATHYLTKPSDMDDILAAFERDSRAADAPIDASAHVPSLARTEWEHIHRVLTDCRGNISLAARLLGIHRRSLQRKIAKYPSAR
jgi:two-component system response regulator RegA